MRDKENYYHKIGASKGVTDLPNGTQPSDAVNFGQLEEISDALALKADLVNGIVPDNQLPRYKDVFQYADLASFPITGEDEIIYIAADTNKIYLWTGSAYTEPSPSINSTDELPEGSINLYFTEGRARLAISAGYGISYDSVTGEIVNSLPLSVADKVKLDGIAPGATANTGTVESVGMTVPTGFSISGSPITVSGTLGLTFTAGYSLPTTVKQNNWDTAFSWGNHAGLYPLYNGTGATGTWGISISGNSATTTKLLTPRNINGVAFDGSANITIVDNTKEPTANKATTLASPNDIKFPTTKAVADAITAGATPDATTLIKGKVKLAGDLSGTADLPTVPGLATKEPIITAGTSLQYWNGDKTWQTLNTSVVPEGTNLYFTNTRVKTYADTLYSVLGHTHPISDVIGLQTALDGKESTIVKGNLIAGTGVTFTGSGNTRLIGTGDLTINVTPTDLSGYVPTARTITINGVTQNLTANRTWTIPAADGSETKINAGTGVTVTGSGTTATPYLISSAYQTLAWNDVTKSLSISNANAVTLSGLVSTGLSITNSYGLVIGGNLTTGLSLGIDTDTTDTRYLRKDVDDNNGSQTLTLGGLETEDAIVNGLLNLASLAVGSPVDEFLTITSTGEVQKVTNSFPNLSVENSVGTEQFAVDIAAEGLRFIGTGDTSISFNAATNAITINSVPGSGTGGAVTSFNSRTGGVVSEAGDYTTAQVTEVTNLYFTQARVRATPLTGFAATNSAIVATDTVLQGFNKAQGQIATKASSSTTLTINGTAGRIITGGGTQSLASNRTWTVDLVAVGTAGTYPKVTTDAYGRVTSGSALATADLPISAGASITISPSGVIANSAPDQTVVLTGAGATTVTGTYPNFTITSTDTNTIYTAGTGISIVGGVINNTIPNISSNLALGTRTTTTMPITNSDGTGVTLPAATASFAGLMIAADFTKLAGIATGANNYILPTATASVLGGIKIGENLSIDGSGVVSATNTTYTGSTSIVLSGTSFQRAALTGDVTSAVNSNATVISSGVVTNTKLAAMPANTLKGNNTASSSAPLDLTTTQVRTLLNIADGATANLGTVTSVASTVAGTALNVAGTPITSSGTLAFTWAGTTAQYVNGQGNIITLNTSVVPESGNLYYTNARTIASILTGFTVGANSTILATDTILAAFGKVQSQINNKGGVSSVAMTTPTGLTVTGSPITSTGTLALTFTAGYSIPTTAKQAQWDTAYGWGNHTGFYISKTADDTFAGKLSPINNSTAADAGIYGNYSSAKLGHIWSIGPNYSIEPDGSNFGTVYGMTYQYTGSNGNLIGGTKAGGHQIVFSANGANGVSIGLAGNIWNIGQYWGRTTDSAAAPTYSWDTAPTKGMYSSGVDSIGFSAGGVSRMTITPSAITSQIPSVFNDRSIFNEQSERRFSYLSNGLVKFSDGASLVVNDASATGFFKIQLPYPTLSGGPMFSMKVFLFQYSATSPTTRHPTEMIITGYGDSAFANCSVWCSNPDMISQVRFGNDGTNKVILINSPTTWQYPKIAIKEVWLSHAGANGSEWQNAANYPITLATDTSDIVVQKTILNADFVRDKFINENYVGSSAITGASVQTLVLDANTVNKTNRLWATTTSTNRPVDVNGFLSTDYLASGNGYAKQTYLSPVSTAANEPAHYFRGIYNGTIGNWFHYASREWVTTQSNANYIGNGSVNGSVLTSENSTDVNSLTKANTIYAGSGSTNLPISSIGVVTTHLISTTGGSGLQTFLYPGGEDSYWFRKRLNGTWGSWFQHASREWVTSQLTLSLGSQTGNITISGGNSVSLSTLNRVTNTNANEETVPGFTHYLTTTGATNFPATTGSGIRWNRNGTGNALGSLDIWQPNASGYPFIRYGTSSTTYSAWERVATQDWSNSQFLTSTQSNNNFIGNGSINGSLIVSEAVDTDSVINTTFITYASTTSLGLPDMTGTYGGMLLNARQSNSIAFQQYMSRREADAFYYRNQSNTVSFQPWNRVASREWVSANYDTQDIISFILPDAVGWTRIAVSRDNLAGIERNAGTFEIDWTKSGNHGSVVFDAGTMYGTTLSTTIVQTRFSSFSGVNFIGQARIVYTGTYTGNYAYVEIYNTSGIGGTVRVKLRSNIGWKLITPIAGDIPAGYTSKSLTFTEGVATTGTVNAQNAVINDIIKGSRLYIGEGTSTAVNFYNTAQITGSTGSYANLTTAEVQSDVTGGAYGYRTVLGTKAATFTLPLLYHYQASQGTFGAGSTVGIQTGFDVSANMVGGATGNMGFRSNLPAATNNYNLYMPGSAQNFMQGNLGLGVLSPVEKLDVVGNAQVSGILKSNQEVRISGTAGNNRILRFSTGSLSSSLPRWTILTEGTPETGSNVGSDLIIARYSDAGSSLGQALSINRSTGNSVFGGSLDVGGNVTGARFLADNAGSATNPTFSWADDLNTGIYNSADDQLSITTGGVARASFNNTGLTMGTGLNVTVTTAPTVGTHATNKDYVDGLFTGATPSARSIIAGNGLTGGGDLTANRTLTLGTPGATTLTSTNAVTTTSHTHAFTPGGTTAQYIRGDGSLATLPASTSNLSLGTRTSTTMPINNSNGTGVSLPVATSTLAGLISGPDKAKLDGGFVDTTTNQIGLAGNKTWTGDHIFNGEVLCNDGLGVGGVSTVLGTTQVLFSNAGFVHASITPDILTATKRRGRLTLNKYDAGNASAWDIVPPISGDIGAEYQLPTNSGTLALLSDLSGFGSGSVTSLVSGNGLVNGTITTSGTITLGTPSAITLTSTNSVTSTSHTHDFAPGGTTAQYISGAGTLISFPTNIATATSLQTARTIWGQSFNGTSNISGSLTGVANITGTGIADFAKFYGNSADTAAAPSYSWTGDTNMGIWHIASDSMGFSTAGVNRFTISSTAITSTLNVTAPTFIGALSGNATTATTLATARTIWGQSFNGSANISGSLTGVVNITASGSITASGDITAFSDRRLKTNINTIEGALGKVLSLRGVTYNRIDDESNSSKIGVIAQEVQKIFPELVKSNGGSEDLLSVNYANMTAILIEAIKEQQKTIDELKTKLDKL